MTLFDDILGQFPPDVQATVRNIWDALGPNEKAGFLSLLTGFPADTNLVKLLVKLSTAQIRQAFGRKHRVVIVGPTNVGKSTLYNQLVQNKRDQAVVGPLPGTTRENQQADAALFTVVDTPGADAVGSVGEQEKNQALSASMDADFLVLVFDAIQGIKKTEQELFNELSALKKPFVVALNKIDLVPRKVLQAVISNAALNLGLAPDQIVPIVAKDGKNIGKVLLAIAATEPEMVAALGQALPEYRWQLAWQTIVRSASISAAIALVPLPVIDFVPLVVTQSIMVVSIARIYNYKITPQRASELVATFGLGFLGRSLFQELSKLGGLPGWLLSAAIASSTTVVMGYAAVRWFEKGEKLSAEALKKLTQGMTTYLLDTLKNFGKRKPDEKGLREQITQALENSPLAESRSVLDSEAGK
ncbi:MAG: GTP-binding protein [Anaerolineaceae bacterium]|nr:MAG: GTP-binding protein [Anaerolineaceae bacterium]